VEIIHYVVRYIGKNKQKNLPWYLTAKRNSDRGYLIEEYFLTEKEALDRIKVLKKTKEALWLIS